MKNGFSPTIMRYLNSVKGGKRQELVNQLSQLQPEDLESFEAKLDNMFREQDMAKAITKLTPQAYKDLSGMNDEQFEMRWGGVMRKYQDGSIVDDSPEFLEEQFGNQVEVPKTNVSPILLEDLLKQGQLPDNLNRIVIQPEGVIHQDPQPIRQDGYVYAVGDSQTQSPKAVEKQIVKEQANTIKSGDSVRAIQQRLKDNGIDIKVDGVFGPKTEAAVRKFQNMQFGENDGIVGSKTKLALGLTDLKGTFKNTLTSKALNIPKQNQSTNQSIGTGKNSPYQRFVNIPQGRSAIDMINSIPASEQQGEQQGQEQGQEQGYWSMSSVGSMPSYQRTYASQKPAGSLDDQQFRDYGNLATTVATSAIPVEGAILKLAPVVKNLPKVAALTEKGTALLTKYSDDIVRVMQNASGKTKAMYEKVITNPKYMDKIHDMVASGKKTLGEAVDWAAQKAKSVVPKRSNVTSKLDEVAENSVNAVEDAVKVTAPKNNSTVSVEKIFNETTKDAAKEAAKQKAKEAAREVQRKAARRRRLRD